MTLDGLKYEVKPLEEGDADLIERKADECRDAIVPPEDDAEEELIFKICDDGGNIIAGCIVEVDGWKVADLDILWVDERYRRQGMGSALIREAERVSREKGCYAMVLGTFDFQARPLYEKHGFMLSGTIEDWPRGHRNFSMMKWLDSSAGGYAAPKDRAYKIEFGTEEDEEFIVKSIIAYNNSQVPYEHESISLGKKVMDDDGNLIAGYVAGVYGWNAVDFVVWVDEPFRNQGIGSALLGEIEREAKEEGGYIVLIDALDWQAPFFEKRGYMSNGMLEDVPKGHRLYSLQKLL